VTSPDLPQLDMGVLLDLFWFNASLGLSRFARGIDYGRCVEFPVIAAEILRVSGLKGRYLDVGSGLSILPTYIAARSQLSVTALDKFAWVDAQRRYLRRLRRSSWLRDGKFSVVQVDFLATSSLSEASFDIVSAVSVLEHMDGDGDTAAVRKIAALLKPGGRFVLSVPFNDLHPRDYYVRGAVYGASGSKGSTFYQRQYSTTTLRRRLLDAAPLIVDAVFFAGHYDRPNLARRIYVLDWPWKAMKVFYNWAAPFYVPQFLRLSDQPPGDADPTMLTVDTAFAFLRKPD